jgi:hypothetical protein
VTDVAARRSGRQASARLPPLPPGSWQAGGFILVPSGLPRSLLVKLCHFLARAAQGTR